LPRSIEKVKPTVIRQDLVMPGTDGLTLVRKYRAYQITKDIPIIVRSTKEEPTVKSEAFATGANDYLVKLPDKIELLARIRYHSKAYWNEVQRDEAFRALRDSQQRLIEANIELQRLNNVDALTGAGNRKHFDEYISTEWRRAARDQTQLAVLMIDESYNDTYGHLAGDEVLRKIAQAARHILGRPADLTARFGGEGFVIVLPGTPLEGAQFVGESVRQAHRFEGERLRDDQHRRRVHGAAPQRQLRIAHRDRRRGALSSETKRQESRRRARARYLKGGEAQPICWRYNRGTACRRRMPRLFRRPATVQPCARIRRHPGRSCSRVSFGW
jgi:diguanylate cyclase (GGDEF)-like protein